MCLLVYCPKGKKVKKEWLEEGFKSNPHGAGMAWNAAGTGRVWYVKELMSFEGFEKAMEGITDESPMLIHFRVASVGKRIPENTHPFTLGTSGWVMAHNGTISGMEVQGDESDTSAFARDIMTPLMENNPQQIFDKDTQKTLEDRIGGSKVLLFGPSGNAVILNQSLGHWRDEIWFSNSSYVPVVYHSRSYPSGQGNHYGWSGEEWAQYFKERDKRKGVGVSELNRSTSNYQYTKNGNWFRVHTTLNGKTTTGNWFHTAAFDAMIRDGNAVPADYKIDPIEPKEDWRTERVKHKRRNRALRAIQREIKDGHLESGQMTGCYCEQCGSVQQKEDTAYLDTATRVIMCRPCTIDLFMEHETGEGDFFQTREEVEDFLRPTDPNTEQNLQLIPDLSEKGLTDGKERDELEEDRVMGVIHCSIF